MRPSYLLCLNLNLNAGFNFVSYIFSFPLDFIKELTLEVVFFIIPDSPTIRTKLVPSGATVTPLNLGMDDAAMELNLSKKHPGKFNEKFQQMLSHGKGVSVFETLNPERLKLEGLQLPLADENFLRSKDSDGFTVLHHAARCNQADVVKFLVEKGAGIDLVEKNGYTPLHVAVR